jgi:hypothetical protein
MLTDKVDFVIGDDTHRDSHTAAVVTAAGGAVERITVATDAFGFRKLDAFARTHAPGRRVWAIEGTGSFGAGLTTPLLEHGEWVDHHRRNGGLTDIEASLTCGRYPIPRCFGVIRYPAALPNLRPVAPATPATVAAAVEESPDRSASQNRSRTDIANSAARSTPLPRNPVS